MIVAYLHQSACPPIAPPALKKLSARGNPVPKSLYVSEKLATEDLSKRKVFTLSFRPRLLAFARRAQQIV